jgi:hypothetical protein
MVPDSTAADRWVRVYATRIGQVVEGVDAFATLLHGRPRPATHGMVDKYSPNCSAAWLYCLGIRNNCQRADDGCVVGGHV